MGGFPIKLNPQDPKNPLIVSKKKEKRIYDGREHILEDSIKGDFALIKAWRVDEKGNTLFKKSARNFNPDCAVAGKICIVEAEEIVPVGSIDPDEVHLPDVYVHRIVKSESLDKPIEFLCVNDGNGSAAAAAAKKDKDAAKRERIVKRAAIEIRDGMHVNLGIGIPTLCSNYLEPGVNITLQSENGILGLGPFPKPW